MEMELISRETIKPSKPTPPHLRIFPLSFIDHITFRNYVPLLFFYTPKEGPECNDDTQVICDQLSSKISQLKKSLSEVLSRYYPIAGKFRDQHSIECNDQGVSFLVTRIRGTKLSAILQNPTETLLNPLFPDELQWKVMDWVANIVSIQINCFPCGGMAISLCMCHKIVDAATAFNFINDWATVNREEEGKKLLPFPVLDAGASVFPHGDLPVFPEVEFGEDKTVVCKRFVFEASKIKSLKAIVSSHSHHALKNPTRAEVVTTLIYKRAVYALGLDFKTTSFRMAVNLCKRMVPPMPNKCVGNMAWFLFVTNPVVTEQHDLVSKMREGLSEFNNVLAKKFGGKEKDLSFISECIKQATTTTTTTTSVPEPCGSSDTEECNQTLFIYASWCRFPAYEADFGWGKPIWVTTSFCPVRNGIVLMDTRDGDGIEAIVNMDEHDMAMFERDVELLQYASLNPNRWAC